MSDAIDGAIRFGNAMSDWPLWVAVVIVGGCLLFAVGGCARFVWREFIKPLRESVIETNRSAIDHRERQLLAAIESTKEEAVDRATELRTLESLASRLASIESRLERIERS